MLKIRISCEFLGVPCSSSWTRSTEVEERTSSRVSKVSFLGSSPGARFEAIVLRCFLHRFVGKFYQQLRTVRRSPLRSSSVRLYFFDFGERQLRKRFRIVLRVSIIAGFRTITRNTTVHRRFAFRIDVRYDFALDSPLFFLPLRNTNVRIAVRLDTIPSERSCRPNLSDRCQRNLRVSSFR